MLYRDSLDNSRTLKIISSTETEHTCRVYFDNRYTGMTTLPVSLFGNEKRHERYGFTPTA